MVAHRLIQEFPDLGSDELCDLQPYERVVRESELSDVP